MAKKSKRTKSEKTDGKRGAKNRKEAPAASISDLLRVPPGPVDLRSYDTRATPGFDGDREEARLQLPELGTRIADLQERLFANGRSGDRRRLLLVLQGMDTSGKGGTVRHVVGSGDPIGLAITSFKAPTPEERAHDFLWRIRREIPQPGYVGVFDRSHYEDVLVVRVKDLVERRVWARRYATINRFEEQLVASECTVVKVMLHMSAEEQRERLLARLEDPTKYWKYQPGDVNERDLWPSYQEAYEAALERCNTDPAPWYIVPADRKWYRNWAISQLLIEHLGAMELDWPAPSFDVDAEKARVVASNPE